MENRRIKCLSEYSLEASAGANGHKSEVQLPVKDVSGNTRLMKEDSILSADVRYPLQACVNKALVKGLRQANAVQVKGVDGKSFWVPIKSRGSLPVVTINREGPEMGLVSRLTMGEDLGKQMRPPSAIHPSDKYADR